MCSRKTSMSFRDDELLRIFNISMETLNVIKNHPSEEKFTLLEEVCITTLWFAE